MKSGRTLLHCGCHINMDRFTVTFTEGEILLQGLLRGGAALAHNCGGNLACATCYVVVREGREGLSQPTDDELDMLDRAGAAEDGARPQVRIAAMGGMPNDVLMFRKSGFSIAMGNASPDAKAAAALVTSSNEEDGVADAIDRFILGLQA